MSLMLSTRTYVRKSVSWNTTRGDQRLLVFWNPGCGFCRSMHEDLLAWEDAAQSGAPRLVVVSSGDAVARAPKASVRSRSRFRRSRGLGLAGAALLTAWLSPPRA
jgi:thiol-disulfide isomerase/thioredoxin